MRGARFRLSVGNLLFAIALIAINCEAWRIFRATPAVPQRNLPLWSLPTRFLVGFLPLFDVALIGSWLALGRWLRGTRRRLDPAPRPAPAGATYFQLQFLAVGYLAFNFMPDATTWALGPISSLEFNHWLDVSRWLEDPLPCHPLEAALLALAISCPLLLLSWVGGGIARRCASTLPRGRFLAISGLTTLGFVALALAIGLMPRPYQETREIAVDFRVVDRQSARPIELASVSIIDAFDLKRESSVPTDVTGTEGLARLTSLYRIRGERNAFQTFATFESWGRWLEISAAGFQAVRVPLHHVLGPLVDLDTSRAWKVELSRGETLEDHFADLAGSFLSTKNEYYGSWFDIRPDGRFAWGEWGCTSSTVEYGSMKRVGGEFKLDALPAPSQPCAQEMNSTLRVVEWDDCLYLCGTGDSDLAMLCQAALTPIHLRKIGDAYGGYLRASDHKKRPTGFPRLPPGVWVQFLIDEIRFSDDEASLKWAWLNLLAAEVDRRLGVEEGSLRLVFEYLIPKTTQSD